MSKFGWDLPPGAANHPQAPWNEPELPDKLTFKGKESEWTVVWLGDWDEGNLPPFNDTIKGLPEDWMKLQWWIATENPCLCGDDLYLALSNDWKTGYMIFDGNLFAYKLDSGVTEYDFLHACCVDPEMLPEPETKETEDGVDPN